MMKNKKAIAPLVILLVGLILVGLWGGGYLKVGSLTGTGQYIERPVFKYIKCESLGSLKYSQDYSISKGGQWINVPSATDQFDVKIKIPSNFGAYLGWKVKYNVCNSKVLSASSCNRNAESATITANFFTIDKVQNGQQVWLEYFQFGLTGLKSSSGATYQIIFIPYGLREYDVLSGSGNQINPNDCEIPSKAKDGFAAIISDDISKTSVVSPKTNERVLQPEEVRWYVSGYLTSASPGFKLNYNGKEAWCRTTGTSAEIYRINTITTDGGTYKVASPDWSDYLGSETCCPKSTRGDEVCQDDFTWKKIAQSECGAFQSCGSPNWVPYSEGKMIKYSCVDGKCQKDFKNVECASDYDCKDANQLCNLNNNKCVDANVNLKGEVLKTIADNSMGCKADGGTWMTEKTEDKSFWNYLGIGTPAIKVNEYCKYPSPWWTWALIIAGILAFIIILPFIFPFIRKLLPF